MNIWILNAKNMPIAIHTPWSTQMQKIHHVWIVFTRFSMAFPHIFCTFRVSIVHISPAIYNPIGFSPHCQRALARPQGGPFGFPAFPQGGRKKALRKKVAVKIGLNIVDFAFSAILSTFRWGEIDGTLA